MPLVTGNTWTLTHVASGTTMTLRVLTADEISAGVRRARLEWVTPWGFSQTMVVRSSSAGIEQEGVVYGSTTYSFANPAPLFPEGNAGQTWSGSGTTSTLLSKSTSLTIGSTTYTNVRQYKVVYSDGTTLLWSLADGTGYVQFGDGASAIPLTASTVQPEPAALRTVQTPGPCPLLGADPNPPTGKTTDNVLTELQQAGSKFYEYSVTWKQLEPFPGVYDLSAVKASVAQAARYGMVAAMTLKTVDTNQRTIPTDLASLAWDNTLMVSRFRGLMRALAPALGTQTKWIQLANEVDNYFLARPTELGGFRTFFNAGRTELRTALPTLSVGLVFAYDSVRLADAAFLGLKDLGDHLGWTFYNLDGTATRAPQSIPVEMATLLQRSAGKPIILTEVGYPSSTAARSSLENQRLFYELMRTELQKVSGSVIAARFFQRTDLPASVVNQFLTYYGTSSAEFAGYLGSLGLYTETGTAKPSWTEFTTTVRQFSATNACYSVSVQ